MTPSPPTGINVVSYSNKVEISWVKNPESDVKGYNVYNSTTSGGGLSGYVKLNNSIIEDYSEVKKETTNSSEVVEETSETRTTTIVEQITNTYIYKYTHVNITENKKQYYIITAVNNLGEESALSIEVESTPLSIPSEIFETTVRSQNDVSLDYITELLEREPNLDVKPGSVMRQLHIDPNSREMSFAYVREDFAMKCQSFLTLKSIDDADGDGISDEVSESIYKTLLKQVFFLDTDSQVQELIDDSFDALASNYGKSRQGATNSSTSAVFYTTILPTSDIIIPLGEIVSTIPTETQSAIQFSTLSSKIMEVSRIDEYYNSITERYELIVSIQAVEQGTSGNVNANTIINTNIAGLSVTNPESAFGGEDEETNADLADRAQLSFVGLDVGTTYGYKRTCAEIPGVRDVKIVTAGETLMQRDYDDVRKKHVYGKVDIYIRGGENTQTEEDVGFLYKQIINEEFNIIDTYEMIIQTTNSLVSISKPIYNVNNIRNVSIGQNYDLLGNWMLRKNGTNLLKDQVTLNLLTGEISFNSPLELDDVILANYQYKSTIIEEDIVNPAGSGDVGDVNFSLEHYPIAKNSFVLIKNGVVLVENTDYTINLVNGFLHLIGSGLQLGDVLISSYDYIITIVDEHVLTATGGEITANLLNGNVLESLLIDQDGITLYLDKNNEINASIGMLSTSLITVTYRYRDSFPIVLSKQPVDEIISITGSISGNLVPNVNYVLNKIDDILLEGNSSKASRSVTIIYANNIPTGELTLSTENLVMINNEYRELNEYGIDIESIVVRQGDDIFLKNNDYLVLPETEGKKVSIARSKMSSIINGSEVEVQYSYGEILTIIYETNQLITTVQNTIDTTRHITADVLVKQVLETKVDLDISVILLYNSDVLTSTSDIRTALSNLFNNLKLGEGIAQSDVIRAIEEVPSVKSLVVPLAKMVKANGTQINREIVGSSFSIYQTNTVISYTTGAGALLCKTLGSNATDGFYAIFEDDRPLVLINSPDEVDSAPGQGYISSIGEIIISTISSDQPALHTYTVSYVVNGETNSSDINITNLEFLSLGEVIITTVTGNR
jgi:uncharacterized phage protein gp47/JayE